MSYEQFQTGATTVAEARMANFFNGDEWTSLVAADKQRRATAELAQADAEITRVLGHGFMQLTGEGQVA